MHQEIRCCGSHPGGFQYDSVRKRCRRVTAQQNVATMSCSPNLRRPGAPAVCSAGLAHAGSNTPPHSLRHCYRRIFSPCHTSSSAPPSSAACSEVPSTKRGCSRCVPRLCCMFFCSMCQCTYAAFLVCRPHHHVRWQSYRFCSTSVPEELSLQASDGKHE